MSTLSIITTGGTIDKVYFDAASEFKVGEPQISEVLSEAGVDFEFTVTPLMRKDSLDMTDADRDAIAEAVAAVEGDRVLVTHGTDTMAQTARVLQRVTGKTIVLTGAMQPVRLRVTDAIFNIGFAVAAAQMLPHGVYLAMNGRVFDPEHVQKNRAQQRFEETD